MNTISTIKLQDGHKGLPIKYLLAIAVLLALPAYFGPYGNFLYASVLIYFLVALSLNVLTGIAGQISIGHVGFWAIGAYGCAVAIMHFHLPFVLAVLVGTLLGALFGVLVALPALRVEGHYLAIATLSFAVLVQQTLLEWESLTGGHQGLSVVRPEILGFEFSDDGTYIYLLLAVAIFSAWITNNFRKSHTGRALLALKGSPISTQMAGISRARHIIVAFSLSGALTGLSGALYAPMIGFLSTDTFTLWVSLAFLSMAVIGGLNSFFGAILGALYMVFVPEVLREFKDAQMLLYGLGLIICIRYLPDGLASVIGVLGKYRKVRK